MKEIHRKKNEKNRNLKKSEKTENDILTEKRSEYNNGRLLPGQHTLYQVQKNIVIRLLDHGSNAFSVKV